MLATVGAALQKSGRRVLATDEILSERVDPKPSARNHNFKFNGCGSPKSGKRYGATPAAVGTSSEKFENLHPTSLGPEASISSMLADLFLKHGCPPQLIPHRRYPESQRVGLRV